MNRIFKTSFLVIVSAFIFSCNKDETPEPVYVVPMAEQYPKDLEKIEKFLKEHKVNWNADTSVKEVKFETTNNSNEAIWNLNENTYPKLKSKMVLSNGVNYKVYYLQFREGNNKRPTTIDSVRVCYRGQLLDKKAADNTFDNTAFEISESPRWFTLTQVIEGWRNIISEFKTGPSPQVTSTGDLIYQDFGAGIMFLPSGLAYYYNGSTNIPSYSCLIFSFQLKEQNYIDHDNDGIDSNNEDIDLDNNPLNDDTDTDGTPNCFDIDDDNDGYSTKSETRKPEYSETNKVYFPFNEIPNCNSFGGTIKRHLDARCNHLNP